MLVDWSIFFSHDDDDDEVFGILGGGWETSLDSLSLLWIFFVVFVLSKTRCFRKKKV